MQNRAWGSEKKSGRLGNASPTSTQAQVGLAEAPPTFG